MENENKKNNAVVWVVVIVVVLLVLVIVGMSGKKNTQGVTEQNQKEEQNVENMIQGENQEVVLVDGGVRYTVLTPGQGDGAIAGSVLSMNYTGKFTDGKVFDSNVDPKFGHMTPLEFVLGGGNVIQGWEIATEGMKVGEKRLVTIAPEFGYGEMGSGPIPPNTTLVFEMELLSIQ